MDDILNDGEWSTVTPEEPGVYLFYGYFWFDSSSIFEQKKELETVKILLAGFGDGVHLMYTTKNSFLYPESENHIGIWKKIDVPSDDELDARFNFLIEIE